jgi:hypothetical protein
MRIRKFRLETGRFGRLDTFQPKIFRLKIENYKTIYGVYTS